MRISSSTTSVPIATLNGLNPSSDCFSGNSPRRHQRAVLALQRHRHAHVAHLVLDRDLHADIEPSPAATTSVRAQADRRVVRSIEQRWRQQVLARAVARALRHARRKIRRRPLAHRGLVDGELVHGNSDVEARSAVASSGHEYRARQLMRRDHVVVTEPRHGAAAIHEDLQQRLLRRRLRYSLRIRRECRSRGSGAGVAGGVSRGRGACLTRRPAPIALPPRQEFESGTVLSSQTCTHVDRLVPTG